MYKSKSKFIHPHNLTLWYRLLNLLGATLLLILLLPFAVIFYPFALIFIGRPIIFKQKRVGQNGKVFTLYKLRSMIKNASALRSRYIEKYQQINQAPEPMFKIPQDPRFIKKQFGPFTINVGYFLSHSGIDELPQLINILKGEMAFVGPRPLPVKEALLLKEKYPQWDKWRHQVKPGIFSYWAFDEHRHRSLNSWKNLEKKTLQAPIKEQVQIIIKVFNNQLKNLLK